MTAVALARFAVAAIGIVVAAGAHALPAAERVHFPSLTQGDAPSVKIEALLFRPANASAPVPAVIALHGCNGLYRDEGNALTARHVAHVEALLAAGYAVLLPDSLRSRGLREVCTVRTSERVVTPLTRRLDTLGALRWLARQPGIDPGRVALLGWSHGGSTALATVNAANRDVRAFREGPVPFFRAAIAFYPGCSAALRDVRWEPAAPVQIYIGAADDWTPASACEALGARARERGWPLDVFVYQGAHHGFDAPRGRIVHRADVPNGVHPGRGVHVGPDPAARDDANRRLARFLREKLGR